jgi:predicted signal transduction protein with EAL and GGDEF domain
MTSSSTRSSIGTWLALVLSWLAVGVPLLWGVAQTVRKALPLFS